MTAKWAKPFYGDAERSVYNKAAKALIQDDTDSAEFSLAAQAVSNWRAAHAYPLHAIAMRLRTRAHAVDLTAPVVQRLKRLASIIPKVKRGIAFTQIQDIGGCRAVLRDMAQLDAVHKKYMAAAAKKDKRRPYMTREPNNYIASPKIDGYRGIHYVFRYRSDQSAYRRYNEMKVEVQIRTRTQHAWATAVEIVDLFTGENLKSDIDRNEADPDWKRFFALMGTVIALQEGCPPVPGTPSSKAELVTELRMLVARLDVINRLITFGHAISNIAEHQQKKGGAYLVTLDADRGSLTLQLYPAARRKQLHADYIEAETRNLRHPTIQIAQITARTFEEFSRAYPNYDVDTSEFVQTIREAIA